MPRNHAYFRRFVAIISMKAGKTAVVVTKITIICNMNVSVRRIDTYKYIKIHPGTCHFSSLFLIFATLFL